MAYVLLTQVDDLSLIHGKYFCVIDLRDAYLQVPLASEAQHILTWTTHLGLFRPTRLVFGLASAPARYQCMMSQILVNIDGLFIYLDDILVSGDTLEECEQRLHSVFERLNHHNVHVNLDKSKFLVPSVEYLGHLIDEHGLHPTESHRDLLQVPSPTCVTDVKSFMGMLNFYHKFLSDLAKVAEPLHRLLRKSEPWQWGELEESAFQSCLQLLASDLVLMPYSLELPLRLTSDASPVGASAVLSHVLEDGTERPVAFASKTFTPAEKNYYQLDREGCAVIFGIKKFEKYLYGRPFELVTDNAAIVEIFNPRKPRSALAVGRLRRWALLLMQCCYTIKHKPGREIPHADFFSRAPSTNLFPVEDDDNVVKFLAHAPVSPEDLRDNTKKDPIWARVLLLTQHGWPEHCDDLVLTPYFRRRRELSLEGGCVMWGTRVLVPRAMRGAVLQLLHAEHPGMSKMK